MDTRDGIPTGHMRQCLAEPVTAEMTCDEEPDLPGDVRSLPRVALQAVPPAPPPDADTASGHEWHWSWNALACRDYRLYFAGSTVSNLGTWLQNTAQALLAYQLTHSVLGIGAVVCAQFLWVLLLGPWATAVVSRTQSLRWLVISTQCVSAAAAAFMATLEFAGILSEAWLITGALILGFAYCFALPATAVLVPAYITGHETDPEKAKQAVRAAMALDNASYNTGRCVAPLFAVLVVARIGYGWAFALNAASFLVLVAVLAKAWPRSVPRNNQAGIVAAIREVRRDPRIQLLLLIVAAVTVTADPVLVLGPALASHFGMPETWAGYFLSALGAGSILGSFVPLPPPSRVRHAVLPLCLLGVAVTVFALGFNRWLSLSMALVAGVACLLTGSVARALLWIFIPEQREEQRRLVMAIWAIAWAGSKPLASLVDSTFATFIGTWAVGVLPGTWRPPSVQAAGVLLAVPALLPGLGVLLRPLGVLLRPLHTNGATEGITESLLHISYGMILPFMSQSRR
jgi:MFS family permease